MPKCGLTAEQRSASPWGLPKTELDSAKTITDPIHGDVWVSRLELRFLDSAPLQRLRRVRQLGTTHLVYPSATHTRFSHALGALRAAQDILDAVLDNAQPGPGSTAAENLFAEWADGLDAGEYHRRAGEAIVLARLGALLHDMCHIPFGHTIEDDLQVLDRHDENHKRFDQLWAKLDPETKGLVEPELLAALKPLILSASGNHAAGVDSYPFVADIVGNTICADLIDYLQRDHYFTGLPASVGRRFLAGFYVTSERHGYFPKRLVMSISRGGHPRADVVSELYKFLRYRYELTERVLVHHAKVAADAMIGKMLDIWSDATWLEIARARHGDVFEDRAFPDVSDARSQLDSESSESIDAEVKAVLERHFTHFGDDGLLQHIAARVESPSAAHDPRNAAISRLATDVLNRRLFKRIGSFSPRANAQEVWTRFGSAEERRRIEQAAADYAGLDHSWYVVVWIPKPDMKLKAAQVLVNDRGTISRLSDLERSGHDRGSEIYEAHKALWAISIYVHPDATDDRRSVVMAYIAEELGLTWAPRGEPLTLEKLAFRKAQGHDMVEDDARSAAQIAARDGTPTFDDYVDRVKHFLDSERQGELKLDGKDG